MRDRAKLKWQKLDVCPSSKELCFASRSALLVVAPGTLYSMCTKQPISSTDSIPGGQATSCRTPRYRASTILSNHKSNAARDCLSALRRASSA